MSLVFYRKYRPKRFAEVIGQTHVVQTLTNALKEKRIGHGYLFFGPRGSGKTTIARLLAKSLNCLNHQDIEPCTICEVCVEIQDGRAIDLVEIDAASNRGIDEIRQLKEDIKFSPVKNEYKVFVIDECHQLTKEAFNAMLKILEEPPAHAIFILATTDIEKVPSTILSRVQIFDFKKFRVQEIFDSLIAIAENEGLEVTDGALKLIALNASGSLRDAQSMFNQVVSFSGRKITEKEVEAVLGLVPQVLISRFVDLLIKKDLKESINMLNQIEQEGHDFEKFIEVLIEYLRKIMILQVDNTLIHLFSKELTYDEQVKILDQVKDFKRDYLLKLLESFLGTRPKMKYIDFPKIAIELVLVENLRAL